MSRGDPNRPQWSPTLGKEIACGARLLVRWPRGLTSKERIGKFAIVHAYMQKFTKEFESMWINQGKVNSTGEKTSETWEEYLELDEQAWICDLTAGEDAE